MAAVMAMQKAGVMVLEMAAVMAMQKAGVVMVLEMMDLLIH